MMITEASPKFWGTGGNLVSGPRGIVLPGG